MDCTALESYLIPRVSKLMKKKVQLAYSIKTIFVGQFNDQKEKFLVKGSKSK